MTLKDIAREANVSISTVSRVLNQPGTTAAAPELQAQIRAIAQRGGYHPNAAARFLKQSASPTAERSVCILVPCPREEVAGNPYFSQLTSLLEEALLDRGLRPGRQFVAADLDAGFPPEALRREPPSGLIIAGRFRQPLLDRVSPWFREIVYVGCNQLSVPCDQIVCNGFHATADAVAYLHGLGHREIGFLGARCEDRIHGYCEGLRRLGLPAEARRMVSDAPLSMEGGYRGAARLLAGAPEVTAVVCANDRMAIGALRACRELGRRVPEDLSIVGTDDIEASKFVTPPLTTIHVPLDEMARMTVDMLISRMEGRHKLPITVLFPHHIEIRQSCRRLSGGTERSDSHA